MQPEQNPYAKPETPLINSSGTDEKWPRNLEVVTGAIRPLDEYRCLLTGRPAGVVPVVLRRMLFMPPIWIGYTAKIAMPLAKKPFLAPWQILRMLRPWVTIILPMYLMHLMSQERDRWGSPLWKLNSSQFTKVQLGIGLLAALGLWFGLGYLLKRFEFVRLLYYNSTDGLIKIRFAKPSVARRASEVLVFPEPPVR